MDLLILPDGTALSAIADVTLQRSVNASEDIAPGSACAAMLECTLYGADSQGITQGMELIYRRDDRDLGLFLCEKPLRTGPNTFTITAYDRMIRFDRDVSGWLEGLPWPVTIQSLLEQLCSHCAVTLAADTVLPGGDLAVEACSGSGITGRQVLTWLGQAAGRFFTVDAGGSLRAGWYEETPIVLGDSCPYRLDSLRHGHYTTAPIRRVMIRASESDVGAVWPDGTDDIANTWVIQGNPLLTAADSAALQPVAKRLYEQLSGYSCTPFSCTLLPGTWPEPGEILRFTDGEGVTHLAPVMHWQLSSGVCSVSATGSPSLESTSACNAMTLGQLQGKLLTLQRGVEGLKVENTDNAGAISAVSLSVEGISARVSAVEEQTGDEALRNRVTRLEQKADSLEISLEQVQQETDTKADEEAVRTVTERFLFREDGLTITNSATGMGIGISQERIEFTGGDAPTTAITPNRMETTNLQVGRRLDVGNFSLIPRTSGNLSLRWTGAVSS